MANLSQCLYQDMCYDIVFIKIMKCCSRNYPETAFLNIFLIVWLWLFYLKLLENAVTFLLKNKNFKIVGKRKLIVHLILLFMH